MKNKGFKLQSGFTLLEVAIVLLIISTLLIAGLKGIGAQMTNASYTETRSNMEVIKTAFITYLRENNQLPCPDLDFANPTGEGDDNRDVATELCNDNFGIVPWRDLRLPRESVLDSFDNFISYRVSTSDDTTDTENWTVAKPITRYINPLASNTGSIVVNDGETDIGGSPFAIVLISHGKNGAGARTIKGTVNDAPAGTSEQANTIADNDGHPFVSRNYTDGTSGEGAFDDVVLALTPQDLLSPLIKDGALVSREGQREAATVATRQNMDVVKAGLISYLREHNYLPCPDTNIVGANSGTGEDERRISYDESTPCGNNFGIVPWEELRLPKESVLDGFDNFFSYRVSMQISPDTQNWTIPKLPISNLSNRVAGNQGSIGVYTGPLPPSLGPPLAVVLVSHGENGDGAWTIDGAQNTLPNNNDNPSERLNTNGTNAFVSRDYTDNRAVSGIFGGTFDDVVLSLTPDDLLNPLIEDGSLKSAQGQVQEQFNDIEARVIGHALSNSGGGSLNCNVPSTVSYTDPWGQVLNYVPDPAGNLNPPVAPGQAYSVLSLGPDQIAGNTDDIPINILWASLRGKIPGSSCP